MLRAFFRFSRVLAYSMDHCAESVAGSKGDGKKKTEKRTKVGVSLGTQEMKTILFLSRSQHGSVASSSGPVAYLLPSPPPSSYSTS